MAAGLVFNIQSYSLQDGPGIRTTVFLKGCPLHCLWCHNPESICPRPEILIKENHCLECGECGRVCPVQRELGSGGPVDPRHADCLLCGACVDACPTGARQLLGQWVEADEVVSVVLKDRMFHQESGGGVTVSGGEPLNQPDFLIDLLRACRGAGIHTALDTTGFGKTSDLLAAAALADLVLYDLKALDDARHRALTGVSNRIILENLRQLDRVHGNLWIRMPIVPGFNDDLANLRQAADFLTNLQHIALVNLLPFHRTGLDKFARLGRAHELDEVHSPSPEWMAMAAGIFEDVGFKVRVGG